MRLEDGLPHPQAGQFWAAISPFTLLQFTSVGTTRDLGEFILAKEWGPGGRSTIEFSSLLLNRERYRYLGFATFVSIPKLGLEGAPRIGDLVVHTLSGHLFFIVGIQNGVAKLATDDPEAIDAATIEHSIRKTWELVQRGPVLTAGSEGPTAWDRLSEGDVV